MDPFENLDNQDDQQLPDNTEEQQEVVETPEYEPNYGFNVKDESFEFDERIRPVITSKENEDYVRELYTKAHGLDSYKTKLEARENDYNQLNAKYSEAESNFNKLKAGVEHLDNLSKNDFGTLQQTLSISDDAVIARAVEIMELEKKSPEERQRIQNLQNRNVEYYNTRQELDSLKQQNEQLMQAQHESQMTSAMAVPEVASFISNFEASMGQGAFRRHVDQYGSAMYYSGQHVSPQQAVEHVVKTYGSLVQPAPATPVATPVPSAPKAPPPPPSNMGSGVNQTATKVQYRSLDDIRKAAEEYARQGL